MTDELTIRVYEIVGTPLCVASDDGQKVHDQIAVCFGTVGESSSHSTT